MRHDPHPGEAKRTHEGRKILAMRVGRAIGHTVGTHAIGKMVAAAVGDGAITAGEFWKMFCPHPVVLKAAVNEYDRFALPDLDIGELSAVGGDPFDIVSHGNTAHHVDEQSSNGCANKIATAHANCHVDLQWKAPRCS